MASDWKFCRARRAVASVLLGAAVLVDVARAGACSCAEPFENELRTGDGQIPANAGVPWWFPVVQTSAGLDSFVTIERIESDVRVRVPAVISRFERVYVIRPEPGWSAGERYLISVDVGPYQGTPEQRFRTAEVEITPALEATMPLGLSLSAARREPVRIADGGGSCSFSPDATLVELSAEAPEGIAGFPLGILYFATYVDGVAWEPSTSLCASIEPGTSWTGPHSDRLVAVCSGGGPTTESLAEGEHTVRMVARLPGTDVTFESAEQLVELHCDSTVQGAVDPSGETPAETFAPGPARNPVAITDSAQGCALSAASAHSTSAAFGFSLGFAALVLGWRRRCRCTTQG